MTPLDNSLLIGMDAVYNESTMPRELRLAHKKNDSAVIAAYGFDENLSESEIVAELMKRYKILTSD